jgi:hypothetical protein
VRQIRVLWVVGVAYERLARHDELEAVGVPARFFFHLEGRRGARERSPSSTYPPDSSQTHLSTMNRWRRVSRSRFPRYRGPWSSRRRMRKTYWVNRTWWGRSTRTGLKPMRGVVRQALGVDQPPAWISQVLRAHRADRELRSFSMTVSNGRRDRRSHVPSRVAGHCTAALPPTGKGASGRSGRRPEGGCERFLQNVTVVRGLPETYDL